MTAWLSALEAAELAAAAYASPATVAADDVHAVLTELEPGLGGALAIAFRGTIGDPGTWLRDLEILPFYDHQLGSCHRGFLAGARAVLPALLECVPADRPVDFVGHSLGAAEAVLAAALFVVYGRPVAGVTLFGAPRVVLHPELGAAALLKPVDVVQYRNGNDPVTEIPPLPFRHVVDQEVAIGRPVPNPLDAHRIAAYQAALGAALPA